MLQVHYSNCIEPLVVPLAQAVEEDQRRDPFTPVTIIVPNRSVSQFLRFQLAQRLGIAANLKFRQLRRFLQELIEDAAPEQAIISVEAIQLLLYHQLLDPALLARPALEPVRQWIEVGEGNEEQAIRRIQLSGRLARLFEEYRFSRLDLLKAWGKGQLLDEGGAWSRSERWQRQRALHPDVQRAAPLRAVQVVFNVS